MPYGAEAIFFNGRIHTFEGTGQVEALASVGGRIIGLGSNEEILGLKGPDTKLVDLQGNTAVPGFIDAHCHMELASRVLNTMPRCHTPPYNSIDEIIQVLKAETGKTPPGSWVFGQGCLLQDQKLEEKRYPTRHDLDTVSVDHPVVLRCGMHVTILNSLALKMAGITRSTPDPAPPTRILRDSGGEPTGILKESFHMLPLPSLDTELLKECILKGAREFFIEKGVTSIHCLPQSVEGIQAYQDLQKEGLLPLRIGLYYEIPRLISLEELKHMGLRSGFGNEYLRFAGAKMFLDGGITGRQAAFHEDYLSEPGWRGRTSFTPEELNHIVSHCHENNVQVLMHAAGDLAQDMAINAVEHAQSRLWRKDHRHRIEHAGNLMGEPHRLERMKALGILPVPNHPFLYSWGDHVEHELGPDRAKRLFLGRTLLDMGFPIAGNSDGTGSQPETMNPMWGVACSVNRKGFSGQVICPEEAISVEEALRMYTVNSAFSGFEERDKGSLKAGKLADMAVLSDDPFKVEKERLGDIEVICTVVGGDVVHSKM